MSILFPSNATATFPEGRMRPLRFDFDEIVLRRVPVHWTLQIGSTGSNYSGFLANNGPTVIGLNCEFIIIYNIAEKSGVLYS